VLWWHAAQRAYETGNLDQLAKLFRSGVPHSRQIGQMLADVFDLCELKRKRRGGQRKLFGMSAEVNAVMERATRRAYETGNLDHLANLFRSGVPHSRQEYQMLAEVFDLCKLKRKRRGGQRKLFGISAEVQKARAERDVRLLQREKSIDELSAHDLRTKLAGFLDLEMDDQVARAQDDEARRRGKLRNSKGRMSRANAIQQVAPHHELGVDKLADWVVGKTGARQRHRGRCQTRDFCEGGFSFWHILTCSASKKSHGRSHRAAGSATHGARRAPRR
jgi:hypothetical protein